MPTSFLLSASLALSQVTGQPCNDQARHLTSSAGNASTGTASCAVFSFTISVGGQSIQFTSPTSCDTGRREQDKDCYDCGPASQGNHCKARGFQANVKICSIGGASPCPTFPEPLPTTLAGASAAVQCQPLPKISSENNWCASVSHCEGGRPGHEVPLVLGNGLGARSLWVGRAFDLDWNRSVPRNEFEAWVRGLLREPVDALPAAMQAAFLETAELEGVETGGAIDILYFKGGVPWISNHFDFTALVTDGGLHVRELEFVPDEDGEVVPRVESLIHDGRMLLVESDGGTVGQAYLPGYSDLPAVLRARLAPYPLLEAWPGNPLGAQRLVGTTYESFDDGHGNPIVIETRQGRNGELELMKTLQLRSARSMTLVQARARGWLVPKAEEWLVYQ